MLQRGSSQDSRRLSPASALDLTRVWLCEDSVRPMCQASSSGRNSTKAWDVLLRPLRGSAAVGVSIRLAHVFHHRAFRACPAPMCSCAHECPARLSSSRVGHSSSQVTSTRGRDLTRQPIDGSSARSPGSIRQTAAVRCPLGCIADPTLHVTTARYFEHVRSRPGLRRAL